MIKGFNNILYFLENNNVLGFVVALLIVNSIKEIASSIIDGIIMPTINPIIKNINSNKNSKFHSIKVGSIIINLKSFFNALIKFFAIIIFIIFLLQFGVKIKNHKQNLV